MSRKPVKIWTPEELLNSGLTGWQKSRYFIGRDGVSGYALIDGNIMDDVYRRLNCPTERYDKILEYRS